MIVKIYLADIAERLERASDGMEQYLNTADGKEGKEYEQYSKWLGTAELDISHFDIDDMNMSIKKLPRIFEELYEYGNAPTKRSLDLLMRNT